jgi:hypothetical protein
MTNVHAKAEGGRSRGAVVLNPGMIQQQAIQNLSAVNVDPGVVKS